jgi:hypothetical protein
VCRCDVDSAGWGDSRCFCGVAVFFIFCLPLRPAGCILPGRSRDRFSVRRSRPLGKVRVPCWAKADGAARACSLVLREPLVRTLRWCMRRIEPGHAGAALGIGRSAAASLHSICISGVIMTVSEGEFNQLLLSDDPARVILTLWEVRMQTQSHGYACTQEISRGYLGPPHDRSP